MTDHLNVDQGFINAIVENAAWDAARVSLVENDKQGDKSKDKPDDKPDFTTTARKGDKSKTKPGKKDFEDEDDSDEMKESVGEHVCPLCESTLDEALSDEKISEHVGQIQDALLAIEEGGDGPSDDDLDAIEAEPDAPSNDDDMDEKKKKKKKSAKKEAVMTKVKELKKAAAGK